MAAIEFQVGVAAFLQAQKTVLQAQQLCPPAPISVGPVQVVVDRFELDNSTFRHNVPVSYTILYRQPGQTVDYSAISVPGFQTQIAQLVTAYVTAFDDLVAHPNGLPDVIVPLPFTIVINVDFYAINQLCYLALSFATLEVGPLPTLPPNFDPLQIPLPITASGIATALTAALTALIPDRVFPLDPLSLLRTVGAAPDPTQIVNAGISVDSQLQRLALHIEIGAPAENPDLPWLNFFQGIFPDRLQGAEFGLFLAGDYIALILQTGIDRAVAGLLPDQLDLFVTSTYSNATGSAVILNSILGIYHLPDPFGPLELNPVIPVTFSVPTPSVLAIDLGFPDISQLADQLEHVIPTFAGPLGFFLQGLINSAVSDLKDPDLGPNCKRTSPSNVHCETIPALPSIAGLAPPLITGLLALDDGISITGVLRQTAFTTGTLSVTAESFEFVPPSFSCAGAGPEIVAAFANSPSSFDILFANIEVFYSGTMPVFFCGAVPLNDPLGVFPASAVTPDYPKAPLTLTVHPPIPPANYYGPGGPPGATDYPCDLLVRTTGGTRFIRIAPPPFLTRADIDRLEADLLVNLVNCEQLVESWFDRLFNYHPEWGIEPPDGEQIAHMWNVEVVGLNVGEAVALQDAAGRTLVTATARDAASLRLSALLAPAGQTELTVLREAAAPTAVGAAASAPVRGIGVDQQLMVQIGLIQLHEPCLDLGAAPILGKPCALAVLQGGLVAYDLSRPLSPSAVATFQVLGLRGVRKWDNGILLFGDSGLQVRDQTGRIVMASSCCEAWGVRDAVISGKWIFALSAHELHVYTPYLCKARSMRLEHGHTAVLVKGKLAVGTAEAIHVYDIGDRFVLRQTSSLKMPHLARVSRPFGAKAGTLLATREDGSALLLSLSADGLQEDAVFPQKPWFDGAVRVGPILVRRAPTDSSLEISRFGPSGVTH